MKKDIPGGSAQLVVRRSGGLTGLARGSGKDGLALIDKQRIASMAGRAQEKVSTHIERLKSGTLAIEIASDLSGSTIDLHTSLKQIAGTIQDGMAQKFPLAKMSFGGFGGEGLIKTRTNARIFDVQHQATQGWESTFGNFATQYAECPDPLRQDVLITFHDAQPKNDENLAQAVKKINAAKGIVVIIYLPSEYSGEEDKQALRDLAAAETGFEKGIFIDFSEVDYANSTILAGFMNDFIAAIGEATKGNSNVATGNDVTSIQAMTKLRHLAGGIVDKVRALSNTKEVKGLLR